MTERKIEIVSEPYFRGVGIFGNGLLLTIILFMVDLLKSQPIEWLTNLMPLITVFVVLAWSKHTYIDRVRGTR